MLAEPRPQIVAVENRLPEGRGRTALIKALDALSGVTAAESGHLAFVDAASSIARGHRRLARRLRTAAGELARAGRTEGFHRSVRAGEASSAAARR